MATPQSVAFHTLGCKLNFSETSAIRQQFEQAGYAVHPFEDVADLYVINTCSVTDFADRKCRKVIRQVLRQNPDARVVVTGCYAQLKPKEISEIPGVDLVLGAAEKFRILDFVSQLDKMPGKAWVEAGEIEMANSFTSAFSFGDRTRSFLKVQDGCDYKCSFCTIPRARGKSRSDTVENVLENARKIAGKGIKELVLTGVNLGDFGNGTAVIEGVKPKKEALFIDLLRALDEIDSIERIRISSIEPNLCTDEIIVFVAHSKRIMPHFHMPLQSGSNEILKQMRRRYRRELYAQRVEKIRALIPHASIGVDVIVGFPGETDAHFQETYMFLSELDISYLHVFTYSERPNTPAAEMEGKVPMHIRRERNEMLRILSQKKSRAFYARHAGQTRPVLIERSKEEGRVSGYTDNYIKVDLPALEHPLNRIVHIEISEETAAMTWSAPS